MEKSFFFLDFSLLAKRKTSSTLRPGGYQGVARVYWLVIRKFLTGERTQVSLTFLSQGIIANGLNVALNSGCCFVGKLIVCLCLYIYAIYCPI